MKRSYVVPVLAAAVTGLAGCQTGTEQPGSIAAAVPRITATQAVTTQVSSRPPDAPAAAGTGSTTAASNGDVLVNGGAVVLPDRTRTPGATNPAVTQATISKTICLTGYTKTIRPSSGYTTALKQQQLRTGYAFHGDLNRADYEEDHLISLELGGSPTSAKNLWPEPYATADGARVKDKIENQLHDLVCSGRLALRTAQQAIAVNWWKAYQRYGGAAAPHAYYGTYAAAHASSTSTSSSGTSSSTSSSSSSAATAQCRDGSYSYSQHRSGTCSQHGGVDHWINPPPS